MSIGDNDSGQLPDKQVVNKGRWKPGESGNPRGRPPKRVSITSLVKELLSQIPDIEPLRHRGHRVPLCGIDLSRKPSAQIKSHHSATGGQDIFIGLTSKY